MRKIMCLASAVLLSASAGFSQSYTIQTFAGGGVPQNVQATTASLGVVTGVAADGGGNVYVALNSYSAVVRINASGAVTLVAGTGTPGFSGDNGPATSAQLNFPWGIALDAAGNLYIADSGNNRIRKVSNGVITTVAGNPGGISLSNPTGVAVDSSNNLYIADAGNSVVRKVSGGVTVTVAGTGTAGFNAFSGAATAVQLSSPWGVAVDSSGNLYIADFGNDAIRKVSSGALTTLVNQQGLGPTGVAVDGAGNLYLASFNNDIVGLVPAVGSASVFAGTFVTGYSGDGGPAASALIHGPANVAVDPAGVVYITDYFNHVVRKVAAGIITTVAGGPQGFVGDNGPATSALLFTPTSAAIGPAGEVYVADSNHNLVRKIANGLISTVAGNGAAGYTGDNGPATSATLNAPWGVAVDASGNLYISDGNNSVIRKVSGGIITTVAGNGTAGFSGDNGAATSATLNGVSGIALDAAGNIYIADFGNNRVRRVANGTITTVAGNGIATFGGDNGQATSASLSGPVDVKVDSAGNLYIADQGNNRIRMVAGGVISTVAGNGTPSFGGDNGAATSAQLNGPSGIAVDTAGTLVIADSRNNVIRKVAGGVITTVAGNGSASYSGDNGPASAAAVNRPLGIATDGLGRIFVADSGNNLVRALNPPCSFALTTTSVQATGAGGSFNIGVQTASFCSWSVSGLPAWITLAGASSAIGPANVTLIVAAGLGTPRSASITIAGISVNVNQAACTYAISPGGQVFTITGGAGVVTVTAPAGCGWSASNSIPFVVLNGGTTGSGTGAINFSVSANAGGSRSGTFTVAGLTFTVEQQSATLTGLNFIGSMPHIAAQENWNTIFTLVNLSGASNQARLNLFGDGGSPLSIPLDVLQAPPVSGLLASSIDRTLAPNGSLAVNSSGPQTPPVQTGSAQLSATGATDGFAIFHLIPGSQEAVVPLETRNASSYLLAFDNTNGLVLGVALANISAQAAAIQVVVRDDTGSPLAARPLPVLAAGGHTSFVVSALFPETSNKRGTIEFKTPSGGRISVLGIRFTPFTADPPALPFNTLTTIPALANIGTGGGSIAHMAVSNGWKTTFVLVNSGASPSVAHLKFFSDNGNPLPLTVSFPQFNVNPSTQASIDPSVGAGAMLMIDCTGPRLDPVQIGSAQLTTDGNIGGFVIFRYEPNGQEAVVPLESRNANAYVLAFDNTNGTGTGIAVNTVSAQPVNIPVIVRDETGTQIATDTLNLAANGHLSFTLVTDKFPETLNKRGTIEFGKPNGAQIGGARDSHSHRPHVHDATGAREVNRAMITTDPQMHGEEHRMKSIQKWLGLGCVALGFVAAGLWAQDTGIKRTVVFTGDVSVPGREARIAHVEIVPGGHAGRHTHPGDEITYVLEGEVELLIDGQPARKFKAGDGFVVYGGLKHDARNAGTQTLKLAAIFVVEKGQPTATQVP